MLEYLLLFERKRKIIDLLEEVKKESFKEMDNDDKKDYILHIVNTNLNGKYKELFDLTNNLSRLELIKEIYKKDNEYIKTLSNHMIKVMSIMQNTKIKLDLKGRNSTFEVKDRTNLKFNNKYTLLMPNPIFTFKIDGTITKIEFARNYKEDVFLYYIIENFENKFLKEVSFKRTLRITY